ncbi:MAG: glycosyltransferase [Candidatus Hodarchaeota archaeon]
MDNIYIENRKKILAILGAIPCYNNIYAGIFNMNQIIELSKNDRYKIDVIFARPMFPKLINWIGVRIKKNFFALDRPIKPIEGKVKIHLVPYLHLPKIGLFMLILTTIFYIIVKKIKFDIIHAYFLFFPGYLGIKLGNFFKKPVVATAMGDDVDFLYGKSLFGKAIQPEIIEKLMTTLRECNVIVAKSNYLKKRIINLGISENKVLVINNGVSKERFHFNDHSTAELNGKKKTILYVGNLIVEKGLVQLLEAIEILMRKKDDFSMVMIGEGPFKKGLLKLIKRLELEEWVRLEGQKNHEEIPQWINKSHVLCLPSYRGGEGLPNVVLESISCGRPVVATNIGGIPEIINNSELGILVPAKDVEKLAQALEEALDREWDREKIAKSGARFYWENILPQFDELYNEVTKGQEKKHI